MPLYWKFRWDRMVRFFFGDRKASVTDKHERDISVLTAHVINLEAQFKYLQQRLDRMEVPR